MKESPLFAKVFDFTKWLLQHTIKFPKSQRFVLAKRIEDAVIGLYDNLIYAVKLPGQRSDHLARADADLERLKHYLRLCRDLELISLRQYEYAAIEMTETGKMLGAWLKKE